MGQRSPDATGHRLRPHLRAVVETLLPSGADPRLPLGALDAGFASFHDGEFSRTASSRMRLGFRVAVATATWVAPLLIRRVPPLARLDPDDRERALEAMASSRHPLLRDLVTLMKLVVCFTYGTDQRVRDAIGAP